MDRDNPFGADNQQETKARTYALHALDDTHVVGNRMSGVWTSSTERGMRSAESNRFCAGILRDCTPGPSVRKEGMIQSDPHGDMGSQAEMT